MIPSGTAINISAGDGVNSATSATEAVKSVANEASVWLRPRAVASPPWVGHPTMMVFSPRPGVASDLASVEA